MGRRRSHPGHIERRGNSYRVVLQIRGHRNCYTIRDATRAEVERFARNKYAELEAEADRHSIGLPQSVQFSRLLTEYEEDVLPSRAPNTITSYHTSLRPIRTYFIDGLNDPALEKVRPAHIKHYLKWRRVHGPGGEPRTRPLSKRTLQKDRAILHLLFHLACELEYVETNPVSAIRPDRPDPRTPAILSDDQYESLLSACAEDPMLGVYCLVLGETGLRCESEALWLQWQDIDLKGGFLWVESGRDGHRTKSGRGRWVPLTGRLRATLGEHSSRFRLVTYRGARSPWVFHFTRNSRCAVAGNRVSSFRTGLNRAAADARIPSRWVPHDLRHRRATSWLADGKSPALVKEALGHASLATTMGYMHLVKENLLGLVGGESELGTLKDLTVDKGQGRATSSRV